MRARHLLPLALVGTLGLAACGSSDSDDGAATDTAAPAPAASAPSTAAPTGDGVAPATSAPTTAAPDPGGTPPATEAPVAVPAALDFSAPLVGGGQIEMGSLAGRPVVLWFWAPT